MGFYIRKALTRGPIRLNLSKSGIGASFGVKGARLGISGSGKSYVHAGRHGLYYRKNLSSGKNGAKTSSESSSVGYIIIFGILIYIALKFLSWLIDHPPVLITISTTAILITAFYFQTKKKQATAFKVYKSKLDQHFVQNEDAIENKTLNQILDCQSEVSKYSKLANKIKDLEENVYSAILDKVLDDKKITNTEKTIIQQFESTIKLDDQYKENTKKDIFRLYYLDIISDHKITDDEYNTLKSIASGLDLKEASIQEEWKVVKEIIKMQELSLPLPTITSTPIKLQKKETPFYANKAQVLSRKKANRNSSSEYEYSIRRAGDFVITDKRILIVNEGTSKVDLESILDIDVDLDNSMIVISKDSSSTPTFIKCEEPLYAAKIIDLLSVS